MAEEEAKLVGTSPTSLAVAGVSFFGTGDFKVDFASKGYKSAEAATLVSSVC